MITRCPQCQFPQARFDDTCRWCGAGLPSESALSGGYAIPQAPETSTVSTAPAVTNSPIIGIPGMAPLISDHASRSNTATITAPPPLAYPTATMTQSQGWLDITRTTHMTGALSTPLWAPPPPSRATRPQIEHWWLIGMALLALGAWGTTRGQREWSGALLAAGHVALAGSIGLGIWVLVVRGLAKSWRPVIAPAITGIVLCVVSLGVMSLAAPADLSQARQYETQGNFASAITLYNRSGSPNDVARVEVAWGNSLTDQGQFAAAQHQLEAAIASAQGATRGAAIVALGHLFWAWGSDCLSRRDLDCAREKWITAQTRAAGTPDAERAKSALSAPQPVSGSLVWFSDRPVVGTRVALVDQWHYDEKAHGLVVGPNILEATTDTDGNFTIQGVKPGTTYAFLWYGGNGFTSRLNSSSHEPIFTVKLQPLEDNHDLGAIAISAS